MATVADRIVQMLRLAGVRNLFGMPGGGSNADMVEAATHGGLPFVLTQTETGGAHMASAQAELSGRAGACLATLGPGAAALANGIANAFLDRIPLLAFTDCLPGSAAAFQHQALQQGALFAPVTRLSLRLTAGDPAGDIRRAISAAYGPPPGPVHVDVPADLSGAPALGAEPAAECLARPSAPEPSELPAQMAAALRSARRPLMLVGLGARDAGTAAALRALCERHGIPALVTYKAKGVMPDRHPWFAGVLTHGALEEPVLSRADLFLAVGLDPVELLAREWHYPQPFFALSPWQLEQTQLPVTAEALGDLPGLLRIADEALPPSCEWDPAMLSELVAAQRAAMRVPRAQPGESGAMPPQDVVDAVAQAYGGAQISVDAGAHMFPVMALWNADGANRVLISNGLATMGYALPAAIGAALLDPAAPVVAFTGDGGLLMCLGELRTAARVRARIRVIVFDDRALSLIQIKQAARAYRTAGSDMGEVDWVVLAGSLGVRAARADDARQLERCLAETTDEPGPVLIAARVDPAPYRAMIRALRG